MGEAFLILLGLVVLHDGTKGCLQTSLAVKGHEQVGSHRT